MSGPLSFGALLGWALLIALLALYGVVGAYAPYVVLALALLASPYLIYVRAGRALVPDLPVLGFAAAFVLLVFAFSLSATKPTDVLIAANFAWLLLFAPMRALLARFAGKSAPLVIARLALAGVVVTLLLALYERIGLHEERVGRLLSDPIRIANTSVILSFIGLIGVIADRGRLRLVYLVGPILAIAVAYLAGTRGAIAASGVIAVVATIMLVRRKWLAVGIAAVLAVLGVGALLIAAQLHVPRIDTLVQTVTAVLTGGTVTDNSAEIRLAMQRVAVAAFQQSPWFGHGWQRLMSVASSFLPPGHEKYFHGQPHLHNDIADFAVAAGAIGLVAYALILFTPLVAALRSPRDSLYRVRLYGIGILTVSYAVLGLNSMMFGYEVHTALFCGLAAVLLGFCRETNAIEADAARPAATISPRRGIVERSLVWLLLALTLVLSTSIGLLTPYVVVVLALATWLVLLFTGRLPESYHPLAGKLSLIAFVLILVDFGLTAKGAPDVLYAFNFSFLFLFGPLLFLMERAGGRIRVGWVSWLAGLGVLLTYAMVFYSEHTGHVRPAGFNLGPIVLSNAVLALAVLATMGAMALRTRLSLLLLLAIPIAVVVTVMTDSRGPLLALLPLMVFTVFMLWSTRFRRNPWFWLATLGLAALVAIAVYLIGHGRITHLPKILGGFFGAAPISDQTTSIRLALYEAGWHAFLDSPWIGHGWARLMSSIYPYIAPDYLEVAKKLPQLHNDVLNFAVSGGIVGVGIYGLIIATPLIAALRSTRDTLRSARIYATGGLLIVYVGGGVTDLMFGHEFHTMLFVMLNAIVLGLVRERADPPPAA